jgi:hypothetical protein
MRDSLKEAAQLAAAARNLFSTLNCPHVDHAIQRLEYCATKETDPTWASLNARTVALRDALFTELKQYNYYQYSKEKFQKLSLWKTDWHGTISAFPSAQRDIFCAVDCFALEHHTASVFHCMRVLERGLGTLAQDVRLNFAIQQWNTIIEQIESKITEARKTLPRGAEKNERMQFLSEAAKEFFYFKDGWRNYVSHNRGDYDEHLAASVLEHTRAFMNHLSNVLSE